MDVGAFLKKFETKNKYEDSGGMKFWNPRKAGAGVYHFRPYRFPRGEGKELFADRLIHFQGKGNAPVDFGTPKSIEIQAHIEHLRSLGDEGSVKKADDLEAVPTFGLVMVLKGEPDGFKCWDMSAAQARNTMLAIASAGMWTGGYPYSDSASEEQLVKFNEALHKGCDVVCGPKGMDLTLVYNTKPKPSYEIKLNPFLKDDPSTMVYEFEEDAEVPDPDVVRQRIAEAKAKKEAGNG